MPSAVKEEALISEMQQVQKLSKLENSSQNTYQDSFTYLLSGLVFLMYAMSLKYL